MGAAYIFTMDQLTLSWRHTAGASRFTPPMMLLRGGS